MSKNRKYAYTLAMPTFNQLNSNITPSNCRFEEVSATLELPFGQSAPGSFAAMFEEFREMVVDQEALLFKASQHGGVFKASVNSLSDAIIFGSVDELERFNELRSDLDDIMLDTAQTIERYKSRGVMDDKNSKELQKKFVDQVSQLRFKLTMVRSDEVSVIGEFGKQGQIANALFNPDVARTTAIEEEIDALDAADEQLAPQSFDDVITEAAGGIEAQLSAASSITSTLQELADELSGFEVSSEGIQGLINRLVITVKVAITSHENNEPFGPLYPFTLDNETRFFDGNEFNKALVTLCEGFVKLIESSDTRENEFLFKRRLAGLVSTAAQTNFLPTMKFKSPGAKAAFVDNHGSILNVVVPSGKHSPQWPFKDIEPGVTILVGGTRSQKSAYIQFNIKPDVIIRSGEPFESYDRRVETIGAASYIHQIKCMMLTSIVGLTASTDSIRNLVYLLESKGTMEGGVAASLFAELTAINNLVASVEGQCIISLNPLISTDKPGAFDAFIERLSGSIAGVLVIDNRNLTFYTYRASKVIDDDEYPFRPSARVPNADEVRWNLDKVKLPWDNVPQKEEPVLILGSPEQPRESFDFTSDRKLVGSKTLDKSTFVKP